MAAGSPIVLNTSSPKVVTPPADQKRVSPVPLSSSSDLASPSTFVKRRPPVLKSGSSAQQAPDGAAVGFVNVSSAWKLIELEEEIRNCNAHPEDTTKERADKEAGKSTGKLVKPKKAASKLKEGESSKQDRSVDEFACLEPEESTAKPKGKPTKAKKKGRTKSIQDKEPPIHQSPALAQPSTTKLAEYALEGPSEFKEPTERNEKINPEPKKRRKRSAKTDDAPDQAPVKKPRKQNKKSESIILNSDEPEPDNGPTVKSNYFVAEQGDAPGHVDNSEILRTARRDVRLDETDTSTTPIVNRTGPEKSGRITSDVDLSAALERQSAYFSKPEPQLQSMAADYAALSLSKTDGSPSAKTNDAVSPDPVLQEPSRARIWTPVKANQHSGSAQERPLTADSEDLEGSGEPKRQLSEILGAFGYVPNDGSAPQRAATGEATTKRRRIELVVPNGVISAGVSPEKAGGGEIVKSAKAKKERKKPQTITAFATAAFQPPKEDVPDNTTVSHFFVPQKDRSNVAAAPDEKPKPKATKPRKPRKPKDTTSDAAGKDTATKASKVKATKKKAAKPKMQELKPLLLSPDRSAVRLKNQDLLFGTSSQLAMDEPASFIRDMQLALHESELPLRSRADGAPLSPAGQLSQVQQSPQTKSCVKVPTAPHGTCLSIEQSHRNTWCVPSRDSDGGLLKDEQLSVEPSIAMDQEAETCNLLPVDVDAGQMTAETSIEMTVSEPAKAVVDLCDTSPVAPMQRAFNNPHTADPSEHLAAEDTNLDCSVHLPEEPVDDDDNWMFVRSSSPPIVETNRAVPSGEEHDTAVAIADMPSPLSKVLSPQRFRPPLSLLNPNKMFTSLPFQKDGPFSHHRPLSSTTVDKTRKPRSPIGRGPGRPRREDIPESFSPTPSKRRGRPPKAKSFTSDQTPQPTRAKKQKTAAASQPAEESDFVDIDDIYDSDAHTPSPPRKRTGEEDTAIQPLMLSPSHSPSIKAKAPAVAAATTLKSKDAGWAANRDDIFTRITATVKSSPPSNDKEHPSWWEKILLYDPIVLEDLTAWLNDQGLRCEVKRPKPKPKKKGRKKKDAPVEEEEEAEWEVHEEPLQHWMVQKWCEHKSVCCLWKEGLRGGVRNRY